LNVFFFFCWNLVLVSWQAFISSIVMKLDFISQPSTNSTLPFAGLQHMQQCQVTYCTIMLSCFWSELMVHDKWSLQRGRDSNPQPIGRESSPLPLDHGVLPNYDWMFEAMQATDLIANRFKWIGNYFSCFLIIIIINMKKCSC
jgi:hypothetical protein